MNLTGLALVAAVVAGGCTHDAPSSAAPRKTLDAFWTTLLDTMEHGTDEELLALQTDLLPGCRSLTEALSPRVGVAQPKQALARAWRATPPRWPETTDADVRAFLGPPRPSMNEVCVRRVGGGWRFAGWNAGD